VKWIVVYKANETLLRCFVALSLSPVTVPGTPQVLERFGGEGLQ
jgi:hypothetical protein